MLLKMGSTGSSVIAVQERLGIKVDGIFGLETEDNVKKFQKEKNLIVDGIVGNITWAALFPASKADSADVSEQAVQTSRLHGCVPDHILVQISEAPLNLDINNNLRLAHFLAQCCHESRNFTATCENLNYSAKGLLNTFPSYFAEPGMAEEYEYHPEIIASRVYANRMGNGDESSKDGYTYRGRGYIQLTGKYNYKKLSEYLGVDVQACPQLVESQYALASAAYFFSENSIWEICDKGSSDDVVERITRIINGGTNGLEDRVHNFTNYYALLMDGAVQ